MSITLIIIIVTVAISLAANNNQELYSKLLFNSYQVTQRKEWHRLISHAFVHDRTNIFHLIFNMYVLYSFGNAVEDFLAYTIGSKAILYYLFIYLGGTMAATIPSLIKHKNNYAYNSVGASGAVSSVLFAAIAFMPLSGGIGIYLFQLVFHHLYLVFYILLTRCIWINEEAPILLMMIISVVLCLAFCLPFCLFLVLL